MFGGQLRFASETAPGYKYNSAKQILKWTERSCRKFIRGLAGSEWQQSRPVTQVPIPKIKIGKKHSGKLFDY